MEPYSTRQFSRSTRNGRRRPRVQIIDPSRLMGYWGFAPAGEDFARARGRLTLEPSGRAHWLPPIESATRARHGRWTLEGSHLLLALDGGPLFDGPVVPLEGRILWGRGIWVRLPPLAIRAKYEHKVVVRPRARGTRRRQRRVLPTLAAVSASAAALILALGFALPL